MSSTLPRWLPLSGLVFVVVVGTIIGLAGDTPMTDAPGAEVAAFYDGEWRQFASVFVFAASAPFIVAFAIALGYRVARASRLGPWELVLFAGAILVAGGILLTATAQFAIIDAVDHELSSASLEAVNTLTGATWVFFNAGFGVMTLGLAGSLLAAGERRVLGSIAFVLGVALFVPYVDFVALLVTLVWIAVVGVVLAHRPAAPQEYAATPAS